MSTTNIEQETAPVVIEDIAPYDDTDDGKDHLTHIINPLFNLHIFQPGMTAQDIVDIARTGSIEITALCGYEFVPKRNPDKYPVCQVCVDVAGEIMRSQGE